VKAPSTAWAAQVAELRPKAGARVEYAAPEGQRGPRGTILAVADCRDGFGWAALVEWDDAARRCWVEAFEPSAFHVGLVKVLP
jgi:hypothetical protein